MNENIKQQLIKPQTIWFAWVPYEENLEEGKDRPVLIIDCNEKFSEILILPIYSDSPENDYNVEIKDWMDIPLDHFSIIMVSRYTTMPYGQLRRFVGKISDHDWEITTQMLWKYIESTDNR